MLMKMNIFSAVQSPLAHPMVEQACRRSEGGLCSAVTQHASSEGLGCRSVSTVSKLAGTSLHSGGTSSERTAARVARARGRVSRKALNLLANPVVVTRTAALLTPRARLAPTCRRRPPPLAAYLPKRVFNEDRLTLLPHPLSQIHALLSIQYLFNGRSGKSSMS